MMGLHHNARSYQRRALPDALQACALHAVVALVLAAMVLSPRLLIAQDSPAGQTQAQTSEQDEFFGEAHRRRIYEESKLSSTRATLYNLALPGMGNVYTEQYFYGGIAFTLMVFTGVFVGYGLVTDQSQFLWLGATTAGVAYAGSIATSLHGVREYNTQLRQGLKLDDGASLGPWDVPKARVVGVSWRF